MAGRQRKAEDIDRLESIVEDFIKSSRDLLTEDHKKIDMVYEFLFLGQPQADPPVQPFVAQVQTALTGHGRDIDSMKTAASRLLWLIVGLVIGGAGWFFTTTIAHVFGK
jgi:hypothetical protein